MAAGLLRQLPCGADSPRQLHSSSLRAAGLFLFLCAFLTFLRVAAVGCKRKREKGGRAAAAVAGQGRQITSAAPLRQARRNGRRPRQGGGAASPLHSGDQLFKLRQAAQGRSEQFHGAGLPYSISNLQLRTRQRPPLRKERGDTFQCVGFRSELPPAGEGQTAGMRHRSRSASALTLSLLPWAATKDKCAWTRAVSPRWR